VKYKVVEVAQKKMFGRSMKAADLEKILNDYAAEGWELDRVLDADTVDFLLGSRDVFLLILKSSS
jgi:hypothetical protein